MVSTSRSWPALEHMFRFYLHEDWSREFENADRALQEYIDWEPWILVHSALQELNALLADRLSEGEALDLLKRFECGYDPRDEAVTAIAWLHAVRRKLERACA